MLKKAKLLRDDLWVVAQQFFWVISMGNYVITLGTNNLNLWSIMYVIKNVLKYISLWPENFLC